MKKFLSARDLLNYLYCPRIVYFEHVLNLPQITTIKEYIGRKKDKEYTKNIKYNQNVKTLPNGKKLFHLFLLDEEMKYNTEIDCAILNDTNVYPLQFKNTKYTGTTYQNIILQLAGEAILLEKNFGLSSNLGYVKYLIDGKIISVNLTDEIKSQFKNTIFEISDIISSECIPQRIKYSKRCIDCCFNRIC